MNMRKVLRSTCDNVQWKCAIIGKYWSMSLGLGTIHYARGWTYTKKWKPPGNATRIVVFLGIPSGFKGIFKRSSDSAMVPRRVSNSPSLKLALVGQNHYLNETALKMCKQNSLPDQIFEQFPV